MPQGHRQKADRHEHAVNQASTPELQCRTIHRDEKFGRLAGKEFHLQKVKKQRRIKIKKDKRLKKKRKEVDLKFMFPTGSARSF